MIKKILLSLSFLVYGCVSVTERTYIEGRSYLYKLYSPSSASGGTGFVMKVEGKESVIVTNRHVCMLADEDGLLVAEQSGVRTYVRVIRMTMDHDLCLVSSPTKVGGFELGDREAEIAEPVWIAGHPSLGPLQVTSGYRVGQEMSVVAYEGGIIDGSPHTCSDSRYKYAEYSIFWYCLQTLPAIQTNAYAAPGSSGSPIFNENGKVIGVLFSGDKQTNITRYVPFIYLKEFLAK